MQDRAIVIVKAGRPDFAEALERGIMAGRAQRLNEHEAQGRRLTAEERAEVARQVKREIGNTKDATDYAIMRTAAEQEYRSTVPGPLRRAARAALGVYGLAIYMAERFLRWEESRWQA